MSENADNQTYQNNLDWIEKIPKIKHWYPHNSKICTVHNKDCLNKYSKDLQIGGVNRE